jgi:acetylornithine/N-succinyldiaminopimelate aminotransferase
MAVADAVLDVMLEKNFLENVRKIGYELKSELQNLHKKFPNIVDEIRGVGLMLGIKINEKIMNTEMTQKLIDQGLLVVPASDNVIRLLPPLNITSKQVNEAIEKLRKAFSSF